MGGMIGGTGGAFSGTGGAPGGGPTWLQSLVQGATKGGLTAAGKGMQQPGQTNTTAIPNAPAAMPVDASYFRPMSPMSAGPMMSGNGQAPGTALYG